MRTSRRLTLVTFAVLIGVAALTGQPPRGDGPPPPTAPKELAAVPRDGFLVVSVDVAQLWDAPALKAARDWFDAQKGPGPETVVGVSPAELARVTFFLPGVGPDRDPEPVVLVTTRRPYNEARVVKNLAGPRDGGEPPARVGNLLQLRNGQPFGTVVLADDRTLLLLPGGGRDNSASAALVAAQLLSGKTEGPLAPALASATSAVTVGFDPRGFYRLVGGGPGRNEFAPYAAAFRATSGTLTADLGPGGVKTRLSLTYPSVDEARRALPVLEEGLADMARLMDDEAKRQGERGDRGELGVAILGIGRDVLRTAKVEAKESVVLATAEGPGDVALAKLVAALPKQVAVARRNAEAQNNLKQILLGIHNYHDVNNHCPGNVGPDRKSAWSWRVQLLPYVEQDNLYRQLNLQLAWDHPQNKAVLERAEMPKVFEVPGRPAPKGHTYWRSFSLPRKTGPVAGRPWLVEGQPGPRLIDVTDGTSNTIAVVEAGEAVPWYAPDVLAYDGRAPLPQLGEKGGDGFLAGMGDGSVRFVRANTDEKTLRAAITRDGGEVSALPER